MSKQQYLEELRVRLKGLSQDEIEELRNILNKK